MSTSCFFKCGNQWRMNRHWCWHLHRHDFIFNSKSLFDAPVTSLLHAFEDRFLLLRALLASIARSKAVFGHLHFADEPSHLRIFLCSQVEKANQLHMYFHELTDPVKLNVESFILAHLEISDSALSSVPSSLAARLMGLFVTTIMGFFHPTKISKKKRFSKSSRLKLSRFQRKNTHLFTFQLTYISTT